MQTCLRSGMYLAFLSVTENSKMYQEASWHAATPRWRLPLFPQHPARMSYELVL